MEDTTVLSTESPDAGEAATKPSESLAERVDPSAGQRIPLHPLEKIALCCSGGGYRAASFHLGSMSYLQRLTYLDKPLLERVEMLSTVSGGTITGIVYALQKQQGRSFLKIYEDLLFKLRTLDLLRSAIDRLNSGAKWNTPTKRKNLINAFAELYDENFTGGATFRDLESETESAGKPVRPEFHLKVIVFNSTEFNKAIDFRFRNQAGGIFGNFFNRVSADVALEIKLADVMAASSCFPGGFEPIMWPSDFVHAEAPTLAAKTADGSLTVTGLMDAGIYDNQGIESVLLYKQGTIPYFDLVIVSDVTSPYMSPYKPTADEGKTGWRNITVGDLRQKKDRIIRKINRAFPIAFLVFVLLPLLWSYENSIATGIFIGCSVMTLALWIAKHILFGKISGLWENVQKEIAEKFSSNFLWQKLSRLNIDKLSFRRVEPLLFDRVNSLLTLMFDVFLKIVRRLNYAKLYENDGYFYRRIGNLIRTLREEDYKAVAARQSGSPAQRPPLLANSYLAGPFNQAVGPAIKEIAELASSFGTTLWFTDKDQLDNMLDALVATGQFTMCYNLIVYLESLLFNAGNGFDKLPETTQEALKTLYKQCKEDWDVFKEKPKFLVKDPLISFNRPI